MSFERLPAPVRSVLVTACVALTLASVPAFAQSDAAPAPAAAPAPQATDVVVSVGGEAITEADIGFAAEDLAQDLGSVPAERRRAFLVAVLIDMKLMAQAARAADLDQTELFKLRAAYLEERALRRAYFVDTVSRLVTEEAVRTAYDEYVAGFTPAEEVRARHIIVSTEEDAAAVKAEIEAGKPFEIAALEYSQDGTAQNGGDLGYFDRESDIVQPFKDAAFALEIGVLSDPVETQFGWHIIRVDDKRMSSPPSLDEIGGQIQQQLMIEAIGGQMAELKSGAEIAFTDPALEAAVAAENEVAVEAGQ